MSGCSSSRRSRNPCARSQTLRALPDPYVVTPDASLDEVVSTMAAKKYGSAIVSDHGHVVGIFTTVDACSAFAALLGTRLSH